MPNWTDNDVYAFGPKESIEKFTAQCEMTHKRYQRTGYLPESPGEWVESKGLLWNFITPPESIQTEDRYWSVADHSRDTDPENWYNWNVKHWGTKWDVKNFVVQQDESLSNMHKDGSHVQLSFGTAWSAPFWVFDAMHAQYPDLFFVCITVDEGSDTVDSITYNVRDHRDLSVARYLRALRQVAQCESDLDYYID